MFRKKVRKMLDSSSESSVRSETSVVTSPAKELTEDLIELVEIRTNSSGDGSQNEDEPLLWNI